MAKKKRTAIRLINAVSTLSQRLERFTLANPAGQPSQRITDDDIRQQKIDYYEQDFKLSVAAQYKKYKFPYKTLGEQSKEADALVNEEQHLLAAYRLFKAVVEANGQFSVPGTCIKENEIVCALTDMEQYTLGDSFVYLQCWLLFEQKARDYIPHISMNPDNSYSLHFYPLAEHRFTYREKEIIAIVQQTFYPSEEGGIF